MNASPTVHDYNDLLFRTQFKALETLARLLQAAEDPFEIRRLLALLVRFKKIKDADHHPQEQPAQVSPETPRPRRVSHETPAAARTQSPAPPETSPAKKSEPAGRNPCVLASAHNTLELLIAGSEVAGDLSACLTGEHPPC